MKQILANHQSPGDIVMLTAAVRDLHRQHPNCYITDVRTPCPALWEHNPTLLRWPMTIAKRKRLSATIH